MEFMNFRSRPSSLVSLPSRVFLSVMMLFVMMIPRTAAAQEGPLDKSAPKGTTVEEIIKHFAAKEKEFKEARDQYTYRQDVKVETLDGETITGMYHEVFDVTYDDKGKHLENVVFAPQSTLSQGGLEMDSGDIEDLRHRLPFVLTSDDV